MARKPTGRRSTIYDIATAAETSASTVSLVLNGSWERYRIKKETAERILNTAKAKGYNTNLQARGLRLSRSSLVGMIIPHYRNRFFAGLAECFEAEARARGLTPIVVSTQRDAKTERSVVETMIAQQVECLIIAGVDDPDPLNVLCERATILCVNLDLPGEGAASVVTDNRAGAIELTTRLVSLVNGAGGDPARIRFVGGRQGEFATEERVAGFLAGLEQAGISAPKAEIERCGYRPGAARQAFERIAGEGPFPPGVFVNSITALEGFTAFLGSHRLAPPPVIACFDWDPFAAALPLPVIMLRQNVEALIAQSFAVVDSGVSERGRRIVVPPTLAVSPAVEADGEEAPSPPPGTNRKARKVDRDG
ncbi:substrate-binding domain-containing protein [Jiella pelagia]|uniref:Substrate-binding domain-containing protein n=1 Tax=Jiella pelagia TaxID=2986949 RepID=A0ABY7C5R0_9HYPH|nr:substrate-binding domain-containing protein [Jiella pelagia]WAP69170.1 substrate-binding domain-containing protein [Jiella pelagia]